MYVLTALTAPPGAGSGALELFSRLTLPDTITGRLISSYVRKAIRLGIWRRLRPESRALLIVARRFRVLRSPTVTSLVRALLLEVETQTLRGKALLYGIIITLKDSFLRSTGVLKDVAKLLVVGISYLNNPPIFKTYS